MASVRVHLRLAASIVQAAAMALLMSWTSGCSITGEPPRARIESTLPSLQYQVAQITVQGSEAKSSSGLGDEALRVAMASSVRYYCSPDGVPSDEPGSLDVRGSRRMVLEFRQPQDVPTAMPLAGWLGPLRGHEEMAQVRQLHVVWRQGQWAEVFARHGDGTWSCWKSNWKTDSS